MLFVRQQRLLVSSKGPSADLPDEVLVVSEVKVQVTHLFSVNNSEYSQILLRCRGVYGNYRVFTDSSEV